jgi:hypothetical protein
VKHSHQFYTQSRETWQLVCELCYSCNTVVLKYLFSQSPISLPFHLALSETTGSMAWYLINKETDSFGFLCRAISIEKKRTIFVIVLLRFLIGRTWMEQIEETWRCPMLNRWRIVDIHSLLRLSIWTVVDRRWACLYTKVNLLANRFKKCALRLVLCWKRNENLDRPAHVYLMGCMNSIHFF